jgi:novobiocin biosynthesis protein NovU/D-mycarose 3-C-methyltransferase
VQIDEEIAPEQLFGDYIYLTGTSDLAREHADRLARRCVDRYDLRAGELVVEIASNDGTVLRAFQRHGVRVLGIEPAANIAAGANGNGVETLCAFFNADLARHLHRERGPARLVLARHVLAHVPDVHGFIDGMRRLLADDGVAVIEVPYLARLYDGLAYDTVYHEHLCYFSLRVLQSVCERQGLELIDAEEVAIHGGSLVVTVQRRGGPHFHAVSVRRLLEREARMGLDRVAPWYGFARRAEASRRALREELDRLAGQRVAGYGAPAKGMTLLAYCGLGTKRLSYLVDKNPLKQGLLTPGHHIPIHPPQYLAQDRPDVLLVLAWNFVEEIVRQQDDFRRRGGRFLLPLPSPNYWSDTAPTRHDFVELQQ